MFSTITADNNITVHASRKAARASVEPAFSSPEHLAELVTDSKRLVAIRNTLPGSRPVTKFTNRQVGIKRIWTTQEPEAPRASTKTETVIGLMKRNGGVSLQEIMTATGWQAHSVRGFVSGTLGKKLGLTVISAKAETGERTYSIQG